MTEILFKHEVYQVIGAAMDVYYHLDPGFAEPVYQESLQIELTRRQIPFTSQCKLTFFTRANHWRVSTNLIFFASIK